MKEELIKYLEEHALFKYELDAGSEQQVRNALDDFFDYYQPERSKREDFVKVNCVIGCNSSYPHDERLYQRCGALNSMET